MAKKKRKTTTAADGRQQQQHNTNSRVEDGGCVGRGGGIPFKTFPLHLVPIERPGSIDDDGDSGGKNNYHYGTNISTLTELCKGRVWVVPSFFTRQECQSWIDFCESTSTLESSYQINRATPYTAHRECYRLQQPDATTLASRIFERLRSTRISSFPEGTSSRTTESVVERLMIETEDIYRAGSISAGNGNALRRQQIVGCNPNLRVYKYSHGHSFGRHVDESNNVPGQGMTGMTVLIYLSECQGGATRFYPNGIYDEDEQKQQQIRRLQQKTASTSKPSAGKKKKNGSRTPSSSSPSSSSSSSFAFQPTIGSMLLHVHGEHCLEHEAEPVLGGNKYVLRTDLVFSDRKG